MQSYKPVQPFLVTLEVVQRMTYSVDARTPEEAEAVAEAYLAEGEYPPPEDISVSDYSVVDTETDDSPTSQPDGFSS